MFYNDGNKYKGEWKDNKRNGKGTLFYNSFFYKNLHGEWRNDKFIG